ncbi:MAG TPA: GDP-mannose 4,6-dehydratase [Phycisphaerales bacterium]|nr:GDP-mannose 4,6-dehydratase [Phycisphaerales bacterium]HMP38283.1 GDP-mannose 4,6-dehydratase [Phycisphaerales bacterium]
MSVPTPNASKRRILVTGGSGFIGSHLVELLLSRGDRVTIVDNLSTGRRANLGGLEGRIDLIESGVSEALRGLRPGDFDEIYHLAAAVGVRLVVERPIHTIETNVLETSAILHFAGDARTPILIASTSEVYGRGVKTPFSEEDDVVYGPTTLSRWSYACSKAIDEYLALACHRERGLPAVVVRFFNTVGPRQVGEYGMVLPRFVARALADEPIEVHGDGRQSRCFCDVRDAVPALPRLLAESACHGRVFNLGNDRSIEIGALAELVRETLGSASPIVLVPYESAFGPGFDDLRRREPDLTRIRAAIGFDPRIPLRQTILDIAAHLRGAGSEEGVASAAVAPGGTANGGRGERR